MEQGPIDKELKEDLEMQDEALTPKQELFCKLYASHEEFFGNGTQSYVEAYNPKQTGNWYKSAQASASRLLSNVKILNRINEILIETGMNDVHIDKQLSFLVTQNADFGTKLGAIREYNKLKKRIDDKPENVTNIVVLPAELVAKNAPPSSPSTDSSGQA